MERIFFFSVHHKITDYQEYQSISTCSHVMVIPYIHLFCVMAWNLPRIARVYEFYNYVNCIKWVIMGGFQKDYQKLYIIADCVTISSVQFSRSVVSDSWWPWDLPVHHQFPESIQTHIHRVGDAIQPSHPLSSPFSSCPWSLPASGF